MCPVTQNGMNPIGNGPPRPAYYETACSCNEIVETAVTMGTTVVTGMKDDGSLWSATEPAKTVKDPSFSPPRDCCVECLVTAKDVQIIYWPVETADIPKNASTTAAPSPYSVVSDGQTFISPSVYVAYRSLGIADNCPAFGHYFAAEDPIDTTIGYPPDALSTSMCNGPPRAWNLYTAINYTNLQYPTGPLTEGRCLQRIGVSGTPRGPVLSIPGDIQHVKPNWASCTGAFEGTFDPPKLLEKASAMVPPTPTPDPGPGAQPGQPVPPAHPPPTPAPNPPAFNPPNPEDGGQQEGPSQSVPIEPDTQAPYPPAEADPGDPGSGGSPPPKGVDPPVAAGPGEAPTQNGGPTNGNPNGSPEIGTSSSGNPGSSNPNNPNPNSGNPNNANPNNANPGSTGPIVQAPSNENPNYSNSGSLDPSINSGGDPGAGAGPGANPPVANSVVANGNTLVRDPYGGVVVGGSTYMPGNTAQLSGSPLSVAPDHIVLGGSSYALAAPAATPILVAGHSIINAPGGGIVIGGSTFAPGTQSAVYGHTVSVGPSHAVVDGSTFALPPSPGAAVKAPAPTTSPVLIGGQSIVRAPGGGIIVGGSTIAPGGMATIAGQAVSVGPSAVVVGGTSYALPTSPGAVVQQGPSVAQNMAAHSALTLANGAVITAGGPAATVDGTVIAIPSDDKGIVINGKTIPITALPAPTATAASVFTVAGQTFTASPTGFMIGSQSLTPGGPAITLSGTVISLGPSGLQIGSSTIPLPSALPSVFTIAGQVFTASPAGFAIGSQSLTPGGSAITLDGTVISLGPSGLQIGTSTIPLSSAEQTADAGGLGSLILGGFGAAPTGTSGGASNGSGVVPFTGEGSHLDGRVSLIVGILLGLVTIVILL